jgi:hypothetical protein
MLQSAGCCEWGHSCLRCVDCAAEAVSCLLVSCVGQLSLFYAYSLCASSLVLGSITNSRVT